MISETVKNNKAYQYALWCVDEDNKKAGKYVKKQCQEFLDCLNDENSKYYIDENELKVIEGFLRLINIMPKKSAYDNLVGFQWFFIINSLIIPFVKSLNVVSFPLPSLKYLAYNLLNGFV